MINPNKIKMMIRNNKLTLLDDDIIFGIYEPNKNCQCVNGIISWLKDGSPNICSCMSIINGKPITYKKFKELSIKNKD